jgi:peptide/nickel transport system substrate-binding protein
MKFWMSAGRLTGIRRGRAWVAMLSLSLMLAACGGGGNDSTPTPAPARPTPTETKVCGSPAAAGTAVSGTPSAAGTVVALPSLLEPPTREEFQRQLLQACPMSQPASEGGTIILGESSDIGTVNGLLASDTSTFLITGAIFESLIGISPLDGRPVPGLADSWDVSDDDLTYTFHLNKDAKWHDGVDFTANDVKFSFDAALDPNTGYFFRSIVNEAVKGYRAIDDDTFEITARDRFVTFLYEGPGAVAIMPQHIWGSVAPDSWSFDGGSTGQDPSRVVGTGPFKFKEWVQGDHVSIVRNDEYYDKSPYVDGLTMRVLPNSDASVIALKQGEIDMMEFVPPAQMESVLSTGGLNVDVYDFFNFTYYALNLDPAKTDLFQEKAVRQALFYSLDRESITRNIFFGYGEAAQGTQPPISPAYAPDRMTPTYPFDPAKAVELFKQAGWTDSDDDGVLDKDGEKLEFDFLYSGGEPVVDQIVTYLKEAWDDVGVKVELRSISGQALIDELESGDFEVALLAVSLSPDGNQSALFSCEAAKSGLNFMDYCSERFDELDERQRREFDAAKRTELLIQQSQTVWEDQPVGPMRFGVARTGYSTRIHNFYPNAYGLLWSLPYIWLEPPAG